MPVTMGSAIADLSSQLTSQLQSSGGARASLGSKAAAFAWSEGLPRGLWSFTRTAAVEGRSFSVLRVAPSGTPVAPVAEGAAKPSAVTLTSDVVPLEKHAGIASFTTEDAIYADQLVQAVTSTLINGSLVSLEASGVTVLGSDAGQSETGTSWTDAILAGVGAVIGTGGNPGLLVMSAADLASAVADVPSLQFSGEDPIMRFLGLQVHLSSGLAAGTAYVLDPAAVLVAESVNSPVAVVDSTTELATNGVRVAVEVMAATVVTSPGSVCAVTLTP